MFTARLLLTAFLSATVTTATAADDALVRRFASLLAGDDVTAIRELAAESVDTSTEWLPVIDVMVRFDCITIESVSGEVVRADAAQKLLRVNIRGQAVTDGAVRRPEALPGIWLLKAVPSARGWRIAAVLTAEHQLALDILEARTDEERRALLDTDLDLTRVAVLLAWYSAEPHRGLHGVTMTQFARDLLLALGDANRAEYARQMEATLYAMLGRADDATRTSFQTVEKCREVCDADMLANAYFTAAIAAWLSEDKPSAIAYFHRAVSNVASMAEPQRAFKAWVNIGHLESSRGHLRSSLAAADAAERLARQYGWVDGQVDALLMQDVAYTALGNNTVATDAGRKAYDLALKLQRHDKLLMTLANLGEHERLNGNLDEAICYFRAARPMSRIDDLSIEMMLAAALEQKGDLAEAKEIYEYVVAVTMDAGPLFASWARMHLSRLALPDDPARALELARAAIASFTNVGLSTSTSFRSWALRAAEGSALRALGRHAEAEEALEAAVAGIEAERDTAELAPATHATYLQSQIGVYHQLLEVRLRRGRIDDALRLSELLKGALLSEMRNAESADLASLLTGEERAEQKAIETEIARLNTELFRARLDGRRAEAVKSDLDDARTRWEKLETALHARHDVRRQRNRIDPLQSPQRLLPSADDVILDYVVQAEHTTLFVLTRGHETPLKIEVHTVDIGERELQREVDRFLNRLGDGSFEYEEDARRLHRLLLEPAAHALRGKKTVAIAGDGPLWRLPFQALQGSDGEPLVKRLAVFYAPSLTSLLQLTERPARTPPSVLAIGNPHFSERAAAAIRARTRAGLGDLPDAAAEARFIVESYDRARSRVVTGREATERAFKEEAAKFDVLHIAAHALLDDQQPLYSGIVLARDSPSEDGLLEGWEITRLGLQARLAVLSACNTAQGQVRPGEGLIGLSWAFLAAGCPTIVASQWRVPSASTSRLMVDFHRELARGGTSVAEALRKAQMRMMKDRRYRHPFYWSGFVVVGAGRS